MNVLEVTITHKLCTTLKGRMNQNINWLVINFPSVVSSSTMTCVRLGPSRTRPNQPSQAVGWDYNYSWLFHGIWTKKWPVSEPAMENLCIQFLSKAILLKSTWSNCQNLNIRPGWLKPIWCDGLDRSVFLHCWLRVKLLVFTRSAYSRPIVTHTNFSSPFALISQALLPSKQLRQIWRNHWIDKMLYSLDP